MNDPVYLTVLQASEVLHLSTSTLAKLRLTGAGPPYLKSGGRRVLYQQADLHDWLMSRRRTSTSA